MDNILVSHNFSLMIANQIQKNSALTNNDIQSVFLTVS